MKTTAQELKELYTAIGGTDDTTGCQTDVAVMKKIYAKLGGEADLSDVQTESQMVDYLTTVASGGGGGGGAEYNITTDINDTNHGAVWVYAHDWDSGVPTRSGTKGGGGGGPTPITKAKAGDTIEIYVSADDGYSVTSVVFAPTDTYDPSSPDEPYVPVYFDPTLSMGYAVMPDFDVTFAVAITSPK